MRSKAVKRTLSCILALTLCAGMLAGTASADVYDNDVYENYEEPTPEETAELYNEDEVLSQEEPGIDIHERDAKTFTEGDWTIWEDGTLYKYAGSDINLVIPEKIAGITVTSIGQNFSFYTSLRSTLTSVTIPPTVETIYKEAFDNCTALTRITIPKNVKTIYNSVFKGCTNLASVEFEAGSELESLGNSAFYRCSKLSSIDIPDKVTAIESDTFYYCERLARIDFPKNLETIGNRAFMNCSDLYISGDKTSEQFTIPGSVNNIGQQAFYKCSGIENLTIEAGDKPLETKVFWKEAFEYCTGLKSLSILGAKEIGEGAFKGCTGLTSLLIENTASIGNSAFLDCSSLTSLVIPGTVKSIGNSAFEGCVNVETIDLQNGIESIGWYAFSSQSKKQRLINLTSVTIPDSVKTIGDHAFWYDTNISEIKLGSGLVTIKNNAFEGTGITRLVLPDSLITLEEGAFKSCVNLQSVHFGEKMNTIGNEAFRGCTELSDVFLSDSTALVGGYAFADCSKLKSFVTGNNMTSIANNTFYEDRNLASVTFPSSIETIGSTVFETCSSLTDIYYIGSLADWNYFLKINRDSYLAKNIDKYIVHCIDGIYKEGESSTLTVTDVKIKTEPLTKVFYTGDALNVDGGYITVTFSDGSSADIAMTTSMIEGFDSSSAGTQTLTVKYGDGSTSYDVEVKAPVPTSIAVSTLPKTEYNQGQPLSAEGGKLTVTFNNGTSQEIDLAADMVTGYEADKISTQKLTVTYNGLTAYYSVTVKEITVANAAFTAPSKKTYRTGEDLDVTGGSIIVTYSDGSTETVKITPDMITGFDSSKEGEQKLKITYAGYSEEYTVTVKNITVTSAVFTVPSKKYYKPGEALDVTGGSIAVTYSDGSKETVPVTADMISGFNPNEESTQKITITYGGQTGQYTVTVSSLDLLSVNGVPADSLKTALAGITKTDTGAVTITLGGDYDKGEKITLPKNASSITIEAPAASPEAPVTLTISNSSLTFAKDVTLKNVVLVTSSEKPVAVTAKGNLTMSGCTTGKVTAKAKADISDSNISGDLKISLKQGESTVENTNVAKKLTVKDMLTVNGNVTVKGAVSAAGLNSAKGAVLSYSALSVSKNGISGGSQLITLIILDKKGNPVKLSSGNVVVKKLKEGKNKTADISKLILGGENAGMTPAYKNGKVIATENN